MNQPEQPGRSDAGAPGGVAEGPGADRPWRVAVWIGLSDKKCLEKLRGLDASEMVSEGLLFRRRPVEGLKKFRQVCPPPFFRRTALLAHLWALLATPWICRRWRPDLCVAVSLIPHCVLAKVGQFVSGSRFAAWFIGTDLYGQLRRRAWRAVLGPALRHAACTMVMGEHSRSMLAKWGWAAQRVIVGQNAYDLAGYEPRPSPKEWDLVYTGRLNRPDKRLDLLLQAVAKARRDLPALRCAIVGEGPDRAGLEALAGRLGLGTNVSFLGQQQDVASILNASRAFILTSAWEGLPASLVEAFACGLPAIVPPVGDIATLAQDMENSLLVAGGTADDYAAAILRLLRDDPLRDRLSRGACRTGDLIRSRCSGRLVSQCWDRLLGMAFGQWQDRP